jgi:hypothetical protein
MPVRGLPTDQCVIRCEDGYYPWLKATPGSNPDRMNILEQACLACDP